jgi:hydroxypyruvate reductase
MVSIEPRDFLTRVYRAAIEAADPRDATRQAVAAIGDLTPRVSIIAVGKGAHRMASGAAAALRERALEVAGGLVVANEPDPESTHGLEAMAGDHPTPGPRSLAAADRLRALAERTTSEADAIVLVSGGATSLIAAPVEGIGPEDLRQAFAALLASGADIELMNAVRKRLLRFGAGRLAMALRSRRVHCLIASDVIGNDPASIASGPCVPDTGTASDTRARARAAGAWDELPAKVRALHDAMADGSVEDVPPRDHPRFATTSVRVILDRTNAERGASAEAEKHGVQVSVRREPLAGEASVAGRRFAFEVLAGRDRGTHCTIWSGETTVTLNGSRAPGGRCQEFALAAAIRLEEAGGKAAGLTILTAGTDGRDGPTDAAGAIVDATTSSRIRDQGIDPMEALRQHDSYRALDAAGALFRTGPTGTNVNDVVIAILRESA